MISGQTVYTNAAEESFILAQNETNPVENTETTAGLEKTAFIEDGGVSQVDLRAKFARLKKAMRKRSASIF